MKQFIVHLDETLKVELLASIGKSLGAANINILSACETTTFGVSTAILLVNPHDEKRAIEVLRGSKIAFSAQDVLIASFPNKPGTLGNFSQLLGDQEIQIQSFYLLPASSSTRTEFAISVKEADFEKAKSFLDASGFLRTFDGI
ncbi:MAG: hypothetical protein ACFFE8_06690 [Candidatus Heimdallarchaeota archaeon]